MMSQNDERKYGPMLKVKLNSDTERVKQVRAALKENDGYCPCAVIKTEDTKCMCREFREQIEQGVSGSCHCDLYVCESEV